MVKTGHLYPSQVPVTRPGEPGVSGVDDGSMWSSWTQIPVPRDACMRQKAAAGALTVANSRRPIPGIGCTAESDPVMSWVVKGGEPG